LRTLCNKELCWRCVIILRGSKKEGQREEQVREDAAQREKYVAVPKGLPLSSSMINLKFAKNP